MDRQTLSLWQEWRDQLWSTFVRLESHSDDSEFYGRVERMNPASNRLSRVMSTRQVTERTPSHLRSDPQDLVLVAVQLSGHGFVEQDDRRARMEIGDFGIYETTRPYRLAFDGPFEQLILRLPRHHFASRLPLLGRATARSYEGRRGPGSVAVGFARQLADAASSLSDECLECFEGAAADVFATAIHLAHEGEDPGDRTRLERIQQRMLGGLRDPELDVGDIAASEGLSVRSLQRVFQMDGATPTRWVLAQRLDRAASDLRNVAFARRSITDIALSWGFNDMSHFSRAFRERFDVSARQWRRGGSGSARSDETGRR